MLRLPNASLSLAFAEALLDGGEFDAVWQRSSMSFVSLRRYSAAGFSWLRRQAGRIGSWIRAKPRLSAWIYPTVEEEADASYRAFNTWYFSGYFEQERMLADLPRMNFYHAAIQRHVQPGDRVIDLGTGTGILAALAARRGAAKVYALDHSDIIECAKDLAQANALPNVEFIATHSTKFSLDERVDVILHEQMGDCLFDEFMAVNVTDLRDRLLKPGGLIIPSRFELYCEPIQVSDDRLIPFIWELNVHGYDYSSLARNRPQDPNYYRLRGGELGLVQHFLGEPEPLLEVDLHTLDETSMKKEFRFIRPVSKPGRLDGFAIYFRARVDDDLILSSSPMEAGRAPHWGFRILRTEQEKFELGDVMEIHLTIGKWPDLDTWRWSHVRSLVASASNLPVRTES